MDVYHHACFMLHRRWNPGLCSCKASENATEILTSPPSFSALSCDQDPKESERLKSESWLRSEKPSLELYLTSCVTLGKFLHLSGLQLLYQENAGFLVEAFEI